MSLAFDTNKVISAALFPESVPRQALEMALSRGELLSSEACLAELNQVLHRPKFARYLTPFEANLFVNWYSLRVRLVPSPSALSDYSPKTTNFWTWALTGRPLAW